MMKHNETFETLTLPHRILLLRDDSSGQKKSEKGLDKAKKNPQRASTLRVRGGGYLVGLVAFGNPAAAVFCAASRLSVTALTTKSGLSIF